MEIDVDGYNEYKNDSEFIDFVVRLVELQKLTGASLETAKKLFRYKSSSMLPFSESRAFMLEIARHVVPFCKLGGEALLSWDTVTEALDNGACGHCEDAPAPTEKESE